MRCAAGFLLILLSATAAAGGEAEDLLDKAIAAMADKPEKIERLKTFSSKASGEFFGRKASREIIMGWPVTFRLHSEFEEEGKLFKVNIVLNRGLGWKQVVGQPPQEMPQQEVADLSDDSVSLYWMETLFPLKEKGVGLKRSPDVQLPGGRANGIRVSRFNRADALVYFDARTHLPVKLAVYGKEAGKKVLREIDYANFKDVDGIKLPFEETESHDGQKVHSWKIEGYKMLDKIDPALLKP